jgi:hypothetical protein
MIEKVVEHDHHQRNDQPQRQIFVKRIQMILPPAERLPVGRLIGGAIQPSLRLTEKAPHRHRSSKKICQLFIGRSETVWPHIPTDRN